MPSFAAVFDARQNALDLVRLLLALVVAATHAMAIGLGWEPSWSSGFYLGSLGVDGFFVLSGFLVTRSYFHVGSAYRFAWHRFLRIMPGYWACMIVSALILAPLAAVVTGRSITAVLTGPDGALPYVVWNAGLVVFQSDIGALFEGSLGGPDFNVSLWSLPFEAACYAVVVAMGVLALLRRRTWSVLLFGLALWAVVIAQEIGMAGPPLLELTVGLVFMFVLGMIGYLYRSRVPSSSSLAAAGVIVFAASTFAFDDYRVGGGVAFAYALLWLSVRRWPRRRLPIDLSYGVYIYHWPLFQLAALIPLGATGRVGYFVAGGTATVLMALLSWCWIERPAMRARSAAFPARLGSLPGRSP